MRPAIHVFESPQAACSRLASEIAELIRSNSAHGARTVLGLATGGTPIPLYRELVRLHREEGVSFRNVTTFNLDEYLGLPREHAESYWHFMHRNLFDHIDVPASNIHLPSGMVEEGMISAHCEEYEQSIRDAGGIDLQVLGIGRTGHIGFNEPGSPQDSRTRRIHLDAITRADAAPAFGGLDHVPTHAITMGCGTILEARRIALLAWGQKKAAIVREAVEGPVSDQVSASYLQNHPSAVFYLDAEAASELTESNLRAPA